MAGQINQAIERAAGAALTGPTTDAPLSAPRRFPRAGLCPTTRRAASS
jgi:hypothetical protein